MKAKNIITDTLRKLSYKNVSIDTTIGRDKIAHEIIKSFNSNLIGSYEILKSLVSEQENGEQ
jgi:hypothetical protein